MVITKGEVVDTAIRKLIGDRSTALTGIAPDSYSKAVEDLEAVMARWQSDGVDLLYNFAEGHDTKAWSQQDSGLERWMLLPVAYNLALVIADDFHREPSNNVISEASKGWRSILRKFSKPGRVKPALPIPEGSGETTTSRPMKGFKYE